ncbi:MAG: FG-GAP repeat domain-containing protein [Pyrinomonadaceae bacterium]
MAAFVLLVGLCLPALLFSLHRAQAVGSAATATMPAPLARLSDTVSVRASGRGAPFVNLSDGRTVLTAYEGASELVQALEQEQARPLALASADFDEDGTPDLVGGYADTANGGGIITLYRGNVDAVYPNSPEAQARRGSGTFTRSPFLSPARVFALAGAADFVGAGDFDGDSHWDVVAASRGGHALYLLSGDGGGALKAVREIEVAGAVTALVAGEINRADGLTDLIIGIEGKEGPQVLVFEGPQGALRARPEALAVPATVSSLALGQLDEEYTADLVVGAGNTLLVVHGRDRKLSLDEEAQATVAGASTEQRAFPVLIKSVAIGDFDGGPESDIAVLTQDGAVQVLSQEMEARQEKGGSEGVQASRRMKASQKLEKWRSEEASSGRWPEASQLVSARVSSTPADSLIVVDSANHQLRVVSGGQFTKGDMTADGKSRAGAAQREVVALDVEGGGPVAVLPMRLSVDALSDLVMFKSKQSAPIVATTGVEPAAATMISAVRDVSNNIVSASALKLPTISLGAEQAVVSLNLLGPSGEVLIPNLQSGLVLNARRLCSVQQLDD